VVLLHGQPGRADHWHGVAQDLVDRRLVIVPDRPGYDVTGGRAQGISANASAVLKLMDDLRIERATVAGHSWAAVVAVALAQRHPHRVDRVVLVSPVPVADRPGPIDRLLGTTILGGAVVLVGFRTAGLALSIPGGIYATRRWLPGLNPNGLHTLRDAWLYGFEWRSFVIEQRALLDELIQLRAGLSSIRVSTDIVVGALDRAAVFGGAGRLAAAIPHARLQIVPGTGHLLPLRHPALVARAVMGVAPRPRPPARHR
jgi:pimeloyl-ACP methyl ester carboxylesterase